MTSNNMTSNNATSDGFHTFEELYAHRTVLFAALCDAHKGKAWKSKIHDDGTMFDGYFIAGIETPAGQATYHSEMKYWSLFEVQEVSRAPAFDGHTSADTIERIKSLLQCTNHEHNEYITA